MAVSGEMDLGLATQAPAGAPGTGRPERRAFRPLVFRPLNPELTVATGLQSAPAALTAAAPVVSAGLKCYNRRDFRAILGSHSDVAPHDSPLRSGNTPEALSGTERDARIEQLLLAGLDAYFAGHYEQAITIWTRVLFLDRHHDRARAYIDRARSAQAELQRESEAVLQQGIDAFYDGDVARAHRLLSDALHRGAPRDDAEGLLNRIERLDAGRTAPVRPSVPLLPDSDRPVPSSGRPSRVSGTIAGLLLAAAGVGVLAVGFFGFALPDIGLPPALVTSRPVNPPAVIPFASDPLPMPAANEVYLARARALYAAGRVRDALQVIERIPLGDPLRGEADRLRSDAQRQLLAVAAAKQPSDLSDSSTHPPE